MPQLVFVILLACAPVCGELRVNDPDQQARGKATLSRPSISPVWASALLLLPQTPNPVPSSWDAGVAEVVRRAAESAQGWSHIKRVPLPEE